MTEKTEKTEKEVLSAEIVKSDAKEIAEVIDPVNSLTERELDAYKYFQSNRHKVGSSYAVLAAPAVAKFFELYLNGMSLDEIQKANPDFGLGQIVHALVSQDWPVQRNQYIADLISRTRDQALQSQTEGVMFISQLMAATHKLHGEKIRRFLQTGDPKDLGPMGAMSIKQYGDLVELQQKLTGQENQKSITAKFEHLHKHVTVPTAPVAPAAADANILAAMAEAEINRKK